MVWCGDTDNLGSESVDIASENVGGGVELPIRRSGLPPMVPVKIQLSLFQKFSINISFLSY